MKVKIFLVERTVTVIEQIEVLATDAEMAVKWVHHDDSKHVAPPQRTELYCVAQLDGEAEKEMTDV